MFTKCTMFLALAIGLSIASPSLAQLPPGAPDPSRFACDDETYATVRGTIRSVLLADPAQWLIDLAQGEMGGCAVDYLAVSRRPSQWCKEGRQITASGRILSGSLIVDSFSCR